MIIGSRIPVLATAFGMNRVSGLVLSFEHRSLDRIPNVDGQPIICTVRTTDEASITNHRCYSISDDHVLRNGTNHVQWKSSSELDHGFTLRGIQFTVRCGLRGESTLLEYMPPRIQNTNSRGQRFVQGTLLSIMLLSILGLLVTHSC
jgi:hypothetical protein